MLLIVAHYLESLKRCPHRLAVLADKRLVGGEAKSAVAIVGPQANKVGLSPCSVAQEAYFALLVAGKE